MQMCISSQNDKIYALSSIISFTIATNVHAINILLACTLVVQKILKKYLFYKAWRKTNSNIMKVSILLFDSLAQESSYLIRWISFPVKVSTCASKCGLLYEVFRYQCCVKNSQKISLVTRPFYRTVTSFYEWRRNHNLLYNYRGEYVISIISEVEYCSVSQWRW